MTATLQTNYSRPRLHQPTNLILRANWYFLTAYVSSRLTRTTYGIAVYKHLQNCISQHYHANCTKQFTNNFSYLTLNVCHGIRCNNCVLFTDFENIGTLTTYELLYSRVQRQFIDKKQINCRQYCFGLLGLISAVLKTRMEAKLKKAAPNTTHVVVSKPLPECSN